MTTSFGHINATVYPLFAEDVASVAESKTTAGSSSLYGVADMASATSASIPVISKSNYLDIHATNTLSRYNSAFCKNFN